MNSAQVVYPQTGMDELAGAWLTAGASAVSLWEQDRLIRQWPGEASLGFADFVTPVRTSRYALGEMCISGFGAPGWTGWNRAGERARGGNDLGSWAGPVLPGAEVAAFSRPALHVGGDYYDFVSQPSGQMAFCVADVCGKGLGAAMLMPGMHSALRRSLQTDTNTAPHHRLRRSNDDIYSLFEHTAGFATALLGRYDARTHTVFYSNAGHSPVIYRSASGESCLLKADSPPLGITKHTNPTPRTVQLAAGDILVVATDGLAEATNRNGWMFGYQRLLELVDALAHRAARTIVRLLLESIAAFAQGAVQRDDQTVIVLKGIA